MNTLLHPKHRAEDAVILPPVFVKGGLSLGQSLKKVKFFKNDFDSYITTLVLHWTSVGKYELFGTFAHWKTKILCILF